jgi:hypothetical protein
MDTDVKLVTQAVNGINGAGRFELGYRVVIQERELVRDEPANEVGADVGLIGMHPHPLLLAVAALGGDQDRTGSCGIKTGFAGYGIRSCAESP